MSSNPCVDVVRTKRCLHLDTSSFTASTPPRGRRGRSIQCMRIGIVTHHATQTNLGLAAAAPQDIRAFVCPPEEAMQLEPGDAALGRLDVRPTLDGVEPGMAYLDLLDQAGLKVLNPPVALLCAHDKLATAPALAAAALPHPRTLGLFDSDSRPPAALSVRRQAAFRKLGSRRLSVRGRARLRAHARRSCARERGSPRPAQSCRSSCRCSATIYGSSWPAVT